MQRFGQASFLNFKTHHSITLEKESELACSPRCCVHITAKLGRRSSIPVTIAGLIDLGVNLHNTHWHCTQKPDAFKISQSAIAHVTHHHHFRALSRTTSTTTMTLHSTFVSFVQKLISHAVLWFQHNPYTNYQTNGGWACWVMMNFRIQSKWVLCCEKFHHSNASYW